MKINDKLAIRPKVPDINAHYGLSGDRINKRVTLKLFDMDSEKLRSFGADLTPTEARELAKSLINMADSVEKDPNS